MEELTSAVRHDLRTPLNHVIGYGEMLLEALADDDAPNGPGVEALREIVARSREQARLLQSARGIEDARAALRDERTLNDIYILSGTLDSRYQDDIAKMRQAAEHIASFANGGAGPANDKPAEPTASAAATAGSRGTLLAV